MSLPKLFADFNNADAEGRLRLNTVGSIRDIEKLGSQFKAGLRVILNDDDELETLGIVEYSERESIWVARIDWDEIKNF